LQPGCNRRLGSGARPAPVPTCPRPARPGAPAPCVSQFPGGTDRPGLGSHGRPPRQITAPARSPSSARSCRAR